MINEYAKEESIAKLPYAFICIYREWKLFTDTPKRLSRMSIKQNLVPTRNIAKTACFSRSLVRQIITERRGGTQSPHQDVLRARFYCGSALAVGGGSRRTQGSTMTILNTGHCSFWVTNPRPRGEIKRIAATGYIKAFYAANAALYRLCFDWGCAWPSGIIF